MQALKDVSIRWKLNLIIILVSGTVLLLAAAAFVVQYKTEFQAAMVNEVKSLAMIIGANSSSALVFDDPQAAVQCLSVLKVKPHIALACVYDKSGNVFSRFIPPGAQGECPREIPPNETHYFADNYLFLFQGLTLNGEAIGSVFIKHDLRELKLKVSRYIVAVLIILALSFFVVALLSNFLQRIISAPVLYLTGIVRSISRNKDYSLRARKQSSDEIGELIDGFNDMVSQIQTRDEHLEKQVAARTFELQQANKKLLEEMEERRQAQESLRKSEERLTRAFDAANDGLWEYNVKTGITYYSPRWYTMLGYEPYEMPASMQTFIHLLHPDDRERVLSVIESFMNQTVNSHTMEFRMKAKPDDFRWILCRGKAAERDDEGKYVRFTGTNTDITELKKAEKEILKARDFLDNVFKTTADGIFVTDIDGYVMRANIRFCEMTGYPEQELIGMHPVDLASEQFFLERPPASMEKLYADGFLKDLEALYKRKDGTVFSAELNIAVLMDSDGSMTGTVCAIKDITARKRAEEERMKLASAVEQAAETILLMDAVGTIQYINPAMEKIMGYSSADLVGRNSFRTEQGAYDQWFHDEIWNAVSKGAVWHGRVTYRKKDGALCNFETTVSPIRSGKDIITGFVSISRDITHELMLERELRQAQKMEAIGTLAGGIAHDFNNILAAIMGYTEMSLHTLPDNLPERTKLEQVLVASRRARDLVKQILAFSRQSEQEKRPVKISGIITEALGLLRASLPAIIEIKSHLHSEACVLADPIQMHQLLINLCTNAAHAMLEAEGTLDITLAEILLTAEAVSQHLDLAPGQYLKMSISDTGTGISADVIDRIFDPYFTTKAVGKGTGLGLSVVHGIVKSHSGSITVESQPGRGTTFHVFLPLIINEAAAESQAVSFSLPSGNERILIVDDEESLVDVARQMLMSLGYTVLTKTSSLEALAAFRKEPEKYDLIITDQAMPHMTGFSLAKNILKLRPEVPIILCSGYSETVSAEKAESLGIKKFIMKPFDKRQLAEAVRKALDGR